MSSFNKPEISTDFGTEIIVNPESSKQQNKQSDVKNSNWERNELIQEPPGCSRAKKKNNRDPFFQIKNPPMLNLIGILFIFTALLLVAPGDSSKLNISISFREFLLLLLCPVSLEQGVLTSVNTRLFYGLAVLYVPIIFGLSGLMIVLVELIEKVGSRSIVKFQFDDVLYFVGGIILLFFFLYPVGLILFGWPFTWIERIMALMIYGMSLFITINALTVA